ncbi:hypothetical protein GWE18_00205 [Bradyrhizobium sp. CSA112]|nr:hypothetical protein [Bradyrhizobium sp. CSA112]MDE5451298.1 hypothetical protein [Bradyrhizobium sp. CSA112]
MALIVLFQAANFSTAVYFDTGRAVQIFAALGLGWLLGLFFSMLEIERS